MDLSALRTALADALNGIDGVYAFPEVPSQLPTGTGDQGIGMVVYPDDPYVGYHGSFGGQGNASTRGALCDVHFLVRAYVPTNDMIEAQRTLDELGSTGEDQGRSVFDALMATLSLGGLAQTLKVERFGAYRIDPDQAMLMAEWAVTVWVRR